MRRSPYRIGPFLRAVEDVWQFYPDERFGQFVMNLTREPGGFADPWEWEDGEWYRRLQERKDAAVARLSAGGEEGGPMSS